LSDLQIKTETLVSAGQRGRTGRGLAPQTNPTSSPPEG